MIEFDVARDYVGTWRERGNYRIQAYLSFIHPSIQALKLYAAQRFFSLVDLTLETILKIPN